MVVVTGMQDMVAWALYDTGWCHVERLAIAIVLAEVGTITEFNSCALKQSFNLKGVVLPRQHELAVFFWLADHLYQYIRIHAARQLFYLCQSVSATENEGSINPGSWSWACVS